MDTTSRQSRELRGRVAELDQLRETARDPVPGGTQRQLDRGKLLARERIERLLDDGTFHEIETLRRHRASGFGLDERVPLTDGVVTGWGEVEGRRVFVYAHDFRVFGGSLGEAHAEKIHKLMDLAESTGAPVVALADGAGARIQEGVSALAGYGGIFRRNVRASGVIPQISVVLGTCAGGAAYAPALTDFVFVVRGVGQLYVTGPDVVRAVTGEEVTHESLGGADLHAVESGTATFTYDDEDECLEDVRRLLGYLPANNCENPPQDHPVDDLAPSERLLEVVPTDMARAYDVRDLLAEFLDDGELFEVNARWARNIVCGLARLAGRVVGVVANQPAVLAGVIDVDAAQKAARFVQMCDAFNIPLLTVVDVPGFLPGTQQERGGIIRHGAKLVYAYCAATVPRVQLVVRKAYGGAYIVMDSRSIGADLSFAWPTNEIAVMGAEGAADVIFARQIKAADDPATTREQLVKQYRRELMHPYYAAERGLVDDVIDPRSTRAVLVEAFAMLADKRAQSPQRKHGNPPQ